MSDNLVLTLEDYQAAADNLGVDVPAVIAVDELNPVVLLSLRKVILPFFLKAIFSGKS